jgi:hypothetical protein
MWLIPVLESSELKRFNPFSTEPVLQITLFFTDLLYLQFNYLSFAHGFESIGPLVISAL